MIISHWILYPFFVKSAIIDSKETMPAITIKIVIKINSNIIVSLSDDNSIKVWDFHSSTCLNTIHPSIEGVVMTDGETEIDVLNFLQFIIIYKLNDNQIVTSSILYDDCMRFLFQLWDITNRNLVQCVRINNEADYYYYNFECSYLNLFRLNDTQIVFSNNNIIRIWDTTIKCKNKEVAIIKSFIGNINLIESILKLSETQIVSIDSIDIIKVWDINHNCLHTLNSDNEYITERLKSLIKLSNNKFATISTNYLEVNKIKIWDYIYGICLKCFRIQNQYIPYFDRVLNINHMELIIHDRKYIRLYDLKDGTCKNSITGDLMDVFGLIKLNINQIVFVANYDKIRIWNVENK